MTRYKYTNSTKYANYRPLGISLGYGNGVFKARKRSRSNGFPAAQHLTRKESEMKTAIIAFTVSFIVSTVIYRSNRRKKNGGR